ncbi:Leucine aminopeptidase 1 [Haplosporangium sp. Z 767]|nr:Leucine aminopeptidase 1 [Haplosporangium sp. Z 11]KAF9178296.1 Leucine aminopeptidase 1 [Haplosporangium sp. Z 767]
MVKLYTLALLSLASAVFAAPVDQPESLRLVQTSEDKAPFWTTEKERMDLIMKDVGFMDITDHQEVRTLAAPAKKPLPKAVSHQDKFALYVDKISNANMQTALTAFTKFNNRYYNAQTGVDSATWLEKQVADLIATSAGKSDSNVRRFSHSFRQFSIIARFEGSNSTLKNSPIVIGSHQDSINSRSPTTGRAPGADDDGSGSIGILEVFRALINVGFRPVRPVEFHWYAGEEVGLLGSQDIAKSYSNSAVGVLAMLQNDMTAYAGTKYAEHFAIVTDNVDTELTKLVKLYAETYGDIAVRETSCGYGCSDHASWTKYGYRSSFAIEAVMSDTNPYIHTDKDDLSLINYDHMKQFAKLALGFAVELGNYRG